MDLTKASNKYPGMIIRRCSNCGTAMGYPTLQVQYCYRNCTYCNRETRDDNKMFDADHMHSRKSRGRGRVAGHARGRRGRSARSPSPKKKMDVAASMGFKRDSVSDQEAAALGLEPVKILAAAWGHSRDPSKALDITTWVLKKQANHPEHKFILHAEELGNPNDLFGDPCPGKRKMFSMRGMYCGRKWETRVFQRKASSKKRPNQLERDICYVQPQNPWLKLTLCTYGHRDDRALQYDVTEKLQERVDTQFDGRYLGVPKDENLVKMFGDPYPGTKKKKL